MNASEEQLIERAQRGDLAAFEALVEAYAVYVYNLALRIVRDPHEAENISQEGFIRAWRGLGRFRSQARFSTWLYQIVTRLCYDRLPRLKRELSALEVSEAGAFLPDGNPTAEEGLLSAEARAHLHAAIDALPAGYRLLVTLRYMQGLSYAEIAQVTGMPLGTVKTGIHRARHRLREALERYEASDGRF